MSEHITHENDNPEAWVCICGNTPSSDGFYPINSKNEEVEPVPEDWDTNQLFCNKCGRVIDQDTLEVVKQLEPASIARLD